MTDLRITVRNTSDTGGVATTPFYFGFHNGDFDLFDVGAQATAGLEALAEDGNFGPIASEREEATGGTENSVSQGVVVATGRGPIAAQEVASSTVTLDAENTQVSFGAMILPSNDAFVGTDDAITLIDEDGAFVGAQTIVFEGTDVYDAGTEFNTELDAAFINQTGPDTGVDEVDAEGNQGVIRPHEGFNGSAGNPDGVLGNPDGAPGAQNILGGTNAFGDLIDPIAADFTLPGAQIAEVHINTVVTIDGTSGRDVVRSGDDDDIVSTGAGRDVILTGAGYDVIDSGDGRDIVFAGDGDDDVTAGAGNDLVRGGNGRDTLDGGEGRDRLSGGDDADLLVGGDGRDALFGGDGSDALHGGAARDILLGGAGADQFLFSEGDGRDLVVDYEAGVDQIVLIGSSFSSAEEVLDAALQRGNGVQLQFDGGDSVRLLGVSADDLTDADFAFV